MKNAPKYIGFGLVLAVLIGCQQGGTGGGPPVDMTMPSFDAEAVARSSPGQAAFYCGAFYSYADLQAREQNNHQYEELALSFSTLAARLMGIPGPRIRFTPQILTKMAPTLTGGNANDLRNMCSDLGPKHPETRGLDYDQ